MEKLVKVQCIDDYHDLLLCRIVKKGEVIEVTESRAVELNGNSNKAGKPLVDILFNETSKEEPQEAPQKRTRKKVE